MYSSASSGVNAPLSLSKSTNPMATKSSGYVNEVSAVVSCVFGSLLGVMRTVEHRQGLGSERGGEREARRRDTQSLSRNGGMFCDQNWTVQDTTCRMEDDEVGFPRKPPDLFGNGNVPN
jgi:hypothetical protein